ncbi:MAG: protein phosphatase 2C domain-containing protein [Methanospirillum sp.]|uniref:PP2C family protein-serine/threonine phosphatase n=1 Tax=Methanospirillum sp. TaxID=45200 RepID=UPI0023697469|nr:protein phosphatase 2C domain-containing protein [Methanospirillum sp.]MDD1729023.1 protein phosphatase 2C domain-containing protein [Methanospirillum sp.]
MQLPLCCAYLTHRGYLRSGNEDSLLVAGTVTSMSGMDQAAVLEVPALPALFAVADGIGGAAHGEVASRMVLEFCSRSVVPPSSDAIIAMIAGAKDHLDGVVRRDPSYSGFGTTVAGVAVFPDYALIFNCGDSRVYLIHEGEIGRLSHDHSLVQELCDQGIITDEQMYTHQYRNIITASVSGDLLRPAPPVLVTRLPRPGSGRLLLCTDGVWEVIRDTLLLSLGSDADIQAAANSLLRACLAGGGPDNITLILIDI